MATYPYHPRAPLPALCAATKHSDSDSGVYLLSAMPLLLLLAEGLAGAWLWHSVQSNWSWPLIIVFTFIASLALFTAGAINLAGIGLALMSLATREGNVISRTLAGLGLVANVAALLPIAWIVVHWLVG